jgi:hypothetical protein
MVCDSDLEYGWSRDRENDGKMGDARNFRQVQVFRRIIALCPIFLYCSWQLVLLSTCPFGGVSTTPFISRGEVTRKVTESVRA